MGLTCLNIELVVCAASQSTESMSGVSWVHLSPVPVTELTVVMQSVQMWKNFIVYHFQISNYVVVLLDRLIFIFSS